MSEQFVAECNSCGVLERGDLETAGDAAEDHDQFHDVQVKRVATDGGHCVDDIGQKEASLPVPALFQTISLRSESIEHPIFHPDTNAEYPNTAQIARYASTINPNTVAIGDIFSRYSSADKYVGVVGVPDQAKDGTEGYLVRVDSETHKGEWLRMVACPISHCDAVMGEDYERFAPHLSAEYGPEDIGLSAGGRRVAADGGRTLQPGGDR